MAAVSAMRTQLEDPSQSSLSISCLGSVAKHDRQNLGLPSGFPTCLDSQLAWTGPELSDEHQYTYTLTENDRLEIRLGLAWFKSRGLDGDLVNSTNFPLPNFQHTLRMLSMDLHNGRGFFILRGLNYDQYSVEDNTVMFLGIQSYIAEQRARQDELGNMLVHVITDDAIATQPYKGHHQRHSKSAIPFHTDEIGDILAFQTRSTAAYGGDCVLSSTYTIYNELAATRPDIICTLAEPNWPIHIPHYHKRPILFYSEPHIIFNFFPCGLLGNKSHPRPPGLPSLSSTQLEALTILQSIAEKHRISFSPHIGDLHFFNNLALVHRRDAIQFVPGSGQKRHLVRMYLRNEALKWTIPGALDWCGRWKDAYRDIKEGEEGLERVWHIEPMPLPFIPLVRNGN